MFVLTPVSALRSGYSTHPAAANFNLNCGYASAAQAADVAVQQAAYEYALAQARVEAIRKQRREEEEAVRRYQEAARHEQAIRRAEVLQLVDALGLDYESPRRSFQLSSRSAPYNSAEAQLQFQRQVATQRRAELERQREEARVKAARAIARQCAEEERRRQALQREREQEHWMSLLASSLGGLQPEASRPTTSRTPIRTPMNAESSTQHQQDRVFDARDLLLSILRPSSPVDHPAPAPAPSVDRKGKGREIPAIPIPSSTPVQSKPQQAPQSRPQPQTLKEQLESRLDSEIDDELKDTLVGLLSGLFGRVASPSHSDKVKIDGKEKSAHPEASSSSAIKGHPSASNAAQDTKGADLHRTPAMSPGQAKELREELRHTLQSRNLSLGTIKRIEDSLHELTSSFVFPTELDFTPSPPATPTTVRPSLPTTTSRPASPSPSVSDGESQFELAYTPRNKPVRAYEHALNGLLSKLDEVESFGDEEVRGRRKEVVESVENALRDVERRVEESRERALGTEVKPAEVADHDNATETSVPAAPVHHVATSSQPTEPVHIEVRNVSSSREESSVEETLASEGVESSEGTVNDVHTISSAESISVPSELIEPLSGDDASPELQLLPDEIRTIPNLAAEPVEVPSYVETYATENIPVDSPTEAIEDLFVEDEPPAVGLEGPATVDHDVSHPSDNTLTTVTQPVGSTVPLQPAVQDEISESTGSALSSPEPDAFLLQSSPHRDAGSQKRRAVSGDASDDDLEIIRVEEVVRKEGVDEGEWTEVE